MTGNSLLINNKNEKFLTCPLCHSNIETTIDNLITEYNNYFNDTITNLFNELEYYEEKFNVISIQIEQQVATVKDLNLLLKDFDLSVSLIEYDKKYDSKPLNKLIHTKRITPNSVIDIDDSLFSSILSFNANVDRVKKELIVCIETINKRIDDLQNNDFVSAIKAKVKEISIAEYNDSANIIIPNSKKSNGEIDTKIEVLLNTLNQKVKILYSKRDIEVSKLDTETKYVNIYLEYLGISDFSIQKDKSEVANNIIINYKSGKKKHSLNCSLSEGEKTALAFAYFLSKIRVERIEKNCKLDETIIVIDDPISSLDENRLYHTANLIDSFLHYNDLSENKIPKQTFILSHNILFLKYITNIFYSNNKIKGNIKEYFLEPFKHEIRQVPNSLKNFTTTYLEKLDEIIKYNDDPNSISYEQAKKYLPNYIRIVLESFLSFKFALVKEGQEKRLPGLNFLIGRANEELKNYDDELKVGDINKKGVIKRLNSLKGIADNESHGSISKIESLNYVSEKELKDCCKYTLQVIRYFDEIHFVKAKSLIQCPS